MYMCVWLGSRKVTFGYVAECSRPGAMGSFELGDLIWWFLSIGRRNYIRHLMCEINKREPSLLLAIMQPY